MGVQSNKNLLVLQHHIQDTAELPGQSSRRSEQISPNALRGGQDDATSSDKLPEGKRTMVENLWLKSENDLDMVNVPSGYAKHSY